MLLPVLIMDLETNLTLRDDERWTSEINRVENETRQRPDDTETVDPLDLDLPSIVQRLNGCSVFLSLIERESEAVLLHLDQARRVILDLQSDLQSTSPKLGEAARTLIRHVDFLIDSRKSLFLRLQNLQRRSQTQLAFVCTCLKDFLPRGTNYAWGRRIISWRSGITGWISKLLPIRKSLHLLAVGIARHENRCNTHYCFLLGIFVAVSTPISLSTFVLGKSYQTQMIARPWCGMSRCKASANHMLVLIRNAPIRLASQLQKRNRGTVLLDLLGIRCTGTRRMGNVDPSYLKETWEGGQRSASKEFSRHDIWKEQC